MEYYEINVSKNGEHYFATSERSVATREKAEDVFRTLKRKFPKSEGYEVSVTYWPNRFGKVLTDEL